MAAPAVMCVRLYWVCVVKVSIDFRPRLPQVFHCRGVGPDVDLHSGCVPASSESAVDFEAESG